jgi:hypothetical protein
MSEVNVLLDLEVEDWIEYSNTIKRYTDRTAYHSYLYLRDIVYSSREPYYPLVLEEIGILKEIAIEEISSSNPGLSNALFGFACLCEKYFTTKEKYNEFRDMFKRKTLKSNPENRQKTDIANPWGHRYNNEQPNENIIIKAGVPFTVSVEWGEGDWESSSAGYGASRDGSNWTWQEINYFKDGTGYNKRCKTTLRIYNVGKYYYAYRIVKNGKISYCLGDSAWKENTSLLAATRYIEVVKG